MQKVNSLLKPITSVQLWSPKQSRKKDTSQLNNMLRTAPNIRRSKKMLVWITTTGDRKKLSWKSSHYRYKQDNPGNTKLPILYKRLANIRPDYTNGGQITTNTQSNHMLHREHDHNKLAWTLLYNST